MIHHLKQFAIAGSLLLCALTAQTQLAPGDLMFVGYNADGSDGLAVVALQDLPANSTIYFTDNEWNGMAIGSGGAFRNANEGELTWNTGPTIIAAGTVVNFVTRQAPLSAAVGSISGILDPNASNEVLYAYLGTDDITPTVFLSAIANNGFNNARGTLDGTGLIEGQTAIGLVGNADVLVYQGDTSCTTTIGACRMAIADPANWASQDGGGDQSMDGGIDFPGSVPISFIGSVLPVTLVLFTGQYQEGNLHIQWETASETNNNYFELLRSTDGLNFEVVHTAQGYGTTRTPQAYSYLEVPSPKTSGYYYQLRQVDLDGRSEEFEVIYVPVLGVEPSYLIYPNPAVSGGRFRLAGASGLTGARLMDVFGTTLKVFSGEELQNSPTMPYLNPGTYCLLLEANHQTQRIRLLIR